LDRIIMDDNALLSGEGLGLTTELVAHEPVAGLPADRLARIAARRAFVDMKLLFMRAVRDLQDRKGDWLRDKVRLATDPLDLWLLRGPVLAALQRDDFPTRGLRAELYRGLDQIFPDAFGIHPQTSGFLPELWEFGASPAAGAQALRR
jgi:hypothetical protein